MNGERFLELITLTLLCAVGFIFSGHPGVGLGVGCLAMAAIMVLK